MSNEKKTKSTIAAMKTRIAKKPEIDARSKRIAKALKDRLAATKMTQVQLAEAVGTTPQYMNKLLKGNNDPSLSSIFPRMVEALRFSPLETHELLTGEKVGNIKHISSIRMGDPLLDLNTPQIVCGIYPKGTKAGDLDAPAPMSTLLAYPPEVFGISGNAENIIALRDMRRNRSTYLNPRDIVYVNRDQQPVEVSTDTKPVYALVDIDDELHIAEVLETSLHRLTVKTLPWNDPEQINRKQCLGTVVARLRLG